MDMYRLRRSALPVLTTLIGSGGFIIGVWSFMSPASAAQSFGGYMARVLDATASSSKTDGTWSESHDKSSNFAYVYSHGIRNLTQGLSILSLTAYWQLSGPCQRSPLARITAQRCLGTVILVGAMTPIVDAWVNYQIAPAGIDGDKDRKAARLHIMRTGIWLAGGLWSLFG